jgi:hypothetical protein
VPIHEYCNDDRTLCTEVLFYVGETIPKEIAGRKRVVSAPAVKIVGALPHHNLAPGSRVVEAGMDKDVARAEQARYDKQDTERKKFIADELSSFDL